jgi:hypothetical protein
MGGRELQFYTLRKASRTTAAIKKKKTHRVMESY